MRSNGHGARIDPDIQLSFKRLLDTLPESAASVITAEMTLPESDALRPPQDDRVELRKSNNPNSAFDELRSSMDCLEVMLDKLHWSLGDVKKDKPAILGRDKAIEIDA
jgi:hypothetical protein